MEDVKSIFTSITMMAGAIVTVLGLVGIEATPEGVNAIMHNLEQISVALGGLLAMYGRFRATKKITL